MKQKHMPFNARTRMHGNRLYQGSIHEFIEEFLKYKLNSEDLQNCVADFEELKRRAANITVDSVSIHSKKKQSVNKNNEKDDCQLNPYNESETNKSAEENASKTK